MLTFIPEKTQQKLLQMALTVSVDSTNYQTTPAVTLLSDYHGDT
jgi:hypothetical protein